MKATLRLLFGVSALALLLTAAPVMAAEVNVTGDNVDTGADSDNNNDFDVDHDVDEDVDNDGDVDNDADVDADTGGNEQNENTNAGDLESGEVDATAEWESIVNAGASLVGAADDGLTVDGDFVNDTTGFNSDNDNDLDVDADIDLTLDNMADITSDLDFDADTGDNEQNQNTNAGSLMSGGAALETVITNWANNDAGFASAAAPEVMVDVTGSNTTTGADSDNNNDFDVDFDYDLDIDNDADVDNDIDVDIDTGGNEQNQNTNAGDLTTGQADVVVEIENSANNGGGMTATAGGVLDVSGDFSNDTTGFNSDNDNDLDVDHDVDVDIDNDADIDNDVDVDAETGDNEQNKNTNAGSTKTGGVTINLGISNEVNSN